MSALAVPNTLVPRTPQNVSKVQENFDAIETWAAGGIGTDNIAANGVGTSEIADLAVTAGKVAANTLTDAQFAAAAGMYSSYRTIGQVTGVVVPSVMAGADHLMLASGPLTETTDSPSLTAPTLYIDSADYAITGRTTNMRVRTVLHVNSVAPAVTITFGLYPITAAGGAAGNNQLTLGAVVSGSTAVFTTPSASTSNQAVSTDFALPANGHYALGVAVSAAGAANCRMIASLQLQLHYT